MKKGWKAAGKQKIDCSMNGNLTYKELLELYDKECMRKGVSDITIKGYDYAGKYFMDYTGEEITCNEINQDLIDNYILWLKNKGIKMTTINSYQYKISPVVNFGYKRGFIERKVEFKRVIEQEEIKEIYTKRELELLLKRPKEKSFPTFRTWVIINTLISTGIRSKELRELRIKNIDLEFGMINLEHTKNRNARIIPVSTTLNMILSEYLLVRNGNQNDPLFCNIYGEALGRTTLQCSVSKYCKNLGIEKTSIHLFRHTFITLSVRKGVSPLILKRITGHKTLKMLNHYYSFDVSDIVSIVDDINPLEDFTFKKKHDFGKYKAR